MCKYKNKSVFPSQRETTAGSSLTLRPHLKARIDTYERRPKMAVGGVFLICYLQLRDIFFKSFFAVCCASQQQQDLPPPYSVANENGLLWYCKQVGPKPTPIRECFRLIGTTLGISHIFVCVYRVRRRCCTT